VNDNGYYGGEYAERGEWAGRRLNPQLAELLRRSIAAEREAQTPRTVPFGFNPRAQTNQIALV
jgi:hypothetical protein